MHDLIERYLERVESMKADATYRTYARNLEEFDVWANDQGYEITDLGPLEMEEFFLQLRNDGYAPKTIAIRYDSIRGLYLALVDKFGAVEADPFENLRRRDYVQSTTRKHDESDISYVTPEEKELLCEHVPAPKLRNELVIRLLWQTGVRKSELVAVELGDLDREERSLSIWLNKTKTRRTVYYQPGLDLLIDQWLDNGYRASFAAASDSPYLLVTSRSAQLPVQSVNMHIVKPAAEAAGIQEIMYQDKGGGNRYRITPHALRHGHAVHALKSGIDVRTVQQHLGHADLEMTMKYLQLIDDDVKEGYREFAGTP